MANLARFLIRIALWASVLMVLLGVAQRMAAAGLGCPLGLGCSEWTAGSGGILTGMSFFIEGHRLLALFLGGVMTAAWVARLFAARSIGLEGLMTWVLACLVMGIQIWSGFHLENFKGIAFFMALQLPLSFVLIALLSQAGHVSSRVSGSSLALSAETSVGPWGGLARLSLLLVFLEVFLGAWVDALGAGLACLDFPSCRGEWFPKVDYGSVLSALFSPRAAPTALLVQGAPEAVHMLHRTLGFLLMALVMVLGLGLSSDSRWDRLSRRGLWLNALVFFSVLSSMFLVVRHLPILLGLLHVLIGILMMLQLLGVLRELSRGSDRPEGVVPLEEGGEAFVESPIPPQVSLRERLSKARGGFAGFLSHRLTIDRSFLDEIEAQLLLSDLGISATQEIMQQLEQDLKRQELKDMDALKSRLKARLSEMIEPVSHPLVIPPDIRPFVILVVGVNGVGKTTTIGKLSKRLQAQGYSVLLAAGDTFRAAAVEQLEVWGERNEIPVISQHQGADSASVIFDAFEAARARKVDILIADTAGRLHTKSNLMEELSKVKRILARLDHSAPHEVLLVLDAGTGQNAVNQTRQFNEAVGLTGLVLTKLDGTAKGGVLFALARQFQIPIRYIGVGEGVEDLRDFDAEAFIAALFDDPE